MHSSTYDKIRARDFVLGKSLIHGGRGEKSRGTKTTHPRWAKSGAKNPDYGYWIRKITHPRVAKSGRQNRVYGFWTRKTSHRRRTKSRDTKSGLRIWKSENPVSHLNTTHLRQRDPTYRCLSTSVGWSLIDDDEIVQIQIQIRRWKRVATQTSTARQRGRTN